MSNINGQSEVKSLRSVRFSVFAGTLSYVLLLMPAMSAYANDFEIYQKPAGGKKTLIMMLDTSGSMDNDDGYPDTRLDRMKNGMNAVLNSTDSKLNDVVMGVGNFSASGDGHRGQVLVPAAALGAVGSTQRTNLKAAIAGLSANSYTPSAHAYAEAASYLMGTSTYYAVAGTSDVAVDKFKVVASYTPKDNGKTGNKRRTTFTYTYNKYTCVTLGTTDFSSNHQSCIDWGSATTTTYADPNTVSGNNPTPQWTGGPTIASSSYDDTDVSGNNPRTTLYFVTQSQAYTGNGQNSGILKSKNNNTTYPGIVTDSTVADASLTYKSPLPAVADRASCDGQGIYFLSDGVPNNSSDTAATTVMKKALQGTSASASTADFGSAFNCTGGLSNINNNSGWACMSKFAQALYAPSTNPSGVSIQTAFVGFGADFNNISASNNVLNACKLSSRLTGDTCSPDATNTTYKNPVGGYGNGGFYPASSDADVTASVLNFIENLGTQVLSPMVTGAATVPIDDLNPNGFQTYGYLRMLEPNPANKNVLLWRGNVKKYNVASGTLKDGNATPLNVLNSDGSLVIGTKDLWNTTTVADGGNIALGGASAKVALPTTASPNTIRPLFTDVGSVTQGTPDVLNGVANGAVLTSVAGTITTAATNIPARFNATNGVAPMKDMDIILKKALINYLGYDLPLDATNIPTTLPIPSTKFLSMGGSVHAQPIQLSYSATINPTTGAITGRTESVLYGSMEGALHLVDASTGAEQMVFVPREILSNDLMSSTLRNDSKDTSATPATPNQGVDGPWVADAAYTTNRTTNKLTASRMDVYGGLRMGGSSFYGLDLSSATAPKLKFRLYPVAGGDYERMGQSWSKPVLANIRYGNVIKRVMIIGGGYDPQYESPSYVPTASSPAKGNTVYMVNTEDGSLIWHATNSNMIHSVVSRISTIDRDADGLIDGLYYGDLGGQVFRADFNNSNPTATNKFSVREVRLANLATDASGTALTGGKNPRIYEPVTVTIHDQGSNTFALIGVVSGNRSSPMDVMPTTIGGRALTGLPTNKVYGIIDRDIARTDLIKLNAAGTAYVNTNGTNFAPITHDLTLANLQSEPQGLTTVIADKFFPAGGSGVKDGWYRSFSAVTSSTGVVTEKADGTIRKPGGMKAFEEPIAITGKLYATVYDPEGLGVPVANPCDPRVVGETDYQTYCLPYGTCLDTTTGLSDHSKDALSGLQYTGAGNTAASLINAQAIGAGIRGLVLGDKGTTSGTCKDFTLVGNTGGTGTWSCTRKLVQTLWYEKKPNATLVK